MGKSAILDPDAREASVVPDELLDGHDLSGKTVVPVAGDFAWAGKTVDWDTLTIVDDVAGAKAAMISAVNARRLEAEDAGCDTPFGVVDSDERSRGLISGAVQMALIAKIGAQPFSESWTMHDNSQVEFDADEMIAMGVAVGIYISAVHARSVALKAEVEAAEDLAAITAIDIATGWPN